MILDTLDHSAIYEHIHPLFPHAFTFLKSTSLMSLPPGRHAIEGDSIYAVVAEGDGKTRENAILESHERYIDIQVPLNGTETIGHKAADRCTGKGYSTEHDVELYSDTPDTWCTVPPGSFAVFFPEDAHAPMISGTRLHKVIIKVQV